MILQHNIATYIACHATELVGIVVGLKLKNSTQLNNIPDHKKINDSTAHDNTQNYSTGKNKAVHCKSSLSRFLCLSRQIEQ